VNKGLLHLQNRSCKPFSREKGEKGGGKCHLTNVLRKEGGHVPRHEGQALEKTNNEGRYLTLKEIENR